MSRAKLVKYLTIILAFGGLFFTLGFFNKYHLPRIKKWALLEIEKQSGEHLPVRTWPEAISFNIFPLGLSVYNIKVLPKKELSSSLAPFSIKQVDVSIGLTHLIQGRLRLNRVKVIGSELTLINKIPTGEDTNPSKTNDSPSSLEIPFESISKLPISELQFKDLSIQVHDKKSDYLTRATQIEASLSNNPLGLIFEFSSPSIQLKKRGELERLRFSSEFQILLEKDALYISKFALNKGEVFIIANGRVNGDMKTIKPKDAKVQMRSNIDLSELDALIHDLGITIKLPRLKGALLSDITAAYEWGTNLYNLSLSVNAKNLSIDGFKVGNIDAKAALSKNSFQLEKLNIHSNAGNLSVSDFEFTSSKERQSFALNLAAEPLKLQPLLENLKVGKIPVQLPLRSILPCTGEITPQFFVECKGVVTAEYLKVRDTVSEDAFNIVDLGKFSVDGTVRVDDKKVVYDAGILLGQSKGHSKGEISYEKGFTIFYDSPEINMTDVMNLAQLKLEGRTKITGNTKGNSSFATIDAQVKTNNVWLEDFGLGNFESHLKYRSGMLHFTQIRGNYNSTRFNGSVALNLLKNRIFVNGESPYFDSQDILEIFSRVAPLSIPITGTGAMKLKVRGPLQFNQLSYSLEAQAFKGSISNENFDKLVFNVTAKNGHAKAQKIQLTKDDGSIDIYGSVSPEAQANLRIKGKHLRIEDSDIIRRLSLSLTGLLDFDLKYTSHLLKPNIQGGGKVHKMVVGDRPAADSVFTGSITPESIELKGDFIGNVVSTNVNFPLVDKKPFIFELKTKSWDFTRVFGIFSDAVSTGEYVTNLTSDLKFESPDGGLDKAKGHMLVSDFSVRRGPVAMYAPRPMELKLVNGDIQLKNFVIEGKNTFLKFLSNPSQNKGLNLTLDGKLDMSLASLITPFLDEIRGSLSLSLAMNGRISSPILIGSAYVDQAYVKFKGFPHPLAQLNADVLFNHKNIVVNAAKGKLADGSFTSAGTIKVHNHKNIEVDIKGQVKDGAFNVPEGFRTHGSGDITFSGSWFPYILGGNFEIDRGRVDKNLSTKGSQGKDITPSDFLPKFLLKENFQPLLLDLNVAIKNPVPVKLLASGLDINTPVSGYLNIKGSPDHPLLTGQINTAKDGFVSFRGNKFDLRVGNVKFNNSSPDNPSLYVSAESRIEAKNAFGDDETKEFDVNLTVQGTAKNPEVNVASQPPLAENELVSLLTLGFISSDKESDSSNLQSKVTNTSVQLGSSFISNQLSQTAFSRSVQDNLGVEFSFSSEFDDAVEETITKFFIKKKVNNQLDVTASRSTGVDKETSFAGTYKLNKNVSVVGTYDFKEGSGSNESATQDSKSEYFGLDLEYKIEFK